MRVCRTAIPDLFTAEMPVHRDSRGFFAETWRSEWASMLKLQDDFVQDNHAMSEAPGVLRGLHFQKPPHSQAKLVWVTRGAVYDVAVDIRAGSPTFGQWHGIVLSAQNMLRFFVPKGFAHGYMCLEPGTELHYKVDAYYNAASEGGIRYDDPLLAIAWPGGTPVLSDKDKLLPSISAIDSPFTYRNM